jgi:hypothetical protein
VHSDLLNGLSKKKGGGELTSLGLYIICHSWNIIPSDQMLYNLTGVTNAVYSIRPLLRKYCVEQSWATVAGHSVSLNYLSDLVYIK